MSQIEASYIVTYRATFDPEAGRVKKTVEEKVREILLEAPYYRQHTKFQNFGEVVVETVSIAEFSAEEAIPEKQEEEEKHENNEPKQKAPRRKRSVRGPGDRRTADDDCEPRMPDGGAGSQEETVAAGSDVVRGGVGDEPRAARLDII